MSLRIQKLPACKHVRLRLNYAMYINKDIFRDRPGKANNFSRLTASLMPHRPFPRPAGTSFRPETIVLSLDAVLSRFPLPSCREYCVSIGGGRDMKKKQTY